MARNQPFFDAIDKPIYTPKQKMKTGLYTEGKALMDSETLEEYVGLFHQYQMELHILKLLTIHLNQGN